MNVLYTHTRSIVVHCQWITESQRPDWVVRESVKTENGGEGWGTRELSRDWVSVKRQAWLNIQFVKDLDKKTQLTHRRWTRVYNLSIYLSIHTQMWGQITFGTRQNHLPHVITLCFVHQSQRTNIITFRLLGDFLWLWHSCPTQGNK